MQSVRTFLVIVFLSCVVVFFNTGGLFAYEYEDAGIEDIRGSGPVPIKNHMPLYLIYLQLPPNKAEVTPKNKFVINADYSVSNVTVSAFTPVSSLYTIDIDAEISRINLDFRYGLCDNFEVGLEIPYLSMSQGFLDNAIEGVEDGLGARTPRSRERQGSYEFDYSFRYNGKYLIQEKHSSEGIGDAVLSAKYQMLKETEYLLPNISLRAALKIPTAEKKNFLGSGEVDYGGGIIIDKGFFNKFFIYLGGSIIAIERPSFFSDLGLDKEMYTWFLAAEYFLKERFSLLVQASGNTTVYPHSETNALDNDGYELGIGLNYTLSQKNNISWNFMIVENVTSASSPDVTVNTGLGWKF